MQTTHCVFGLAGLKWWRLATNAVECLTSIDGYGARCIKHWQRRMWRYDFAGFPANIDKADREIAVLICHWHVLISTTGMWSDSLATPLASTHFYNASDTINAEEFLHCTISALSTHSYTHTTHNTHISEPHWPRNECCVVELIFNQW